MQHDKRYIRTHEALIDSLIQILGEKSYPEIKVHEIWANCGYSKAVFYNHFRNKEDCLRESIEKELACFEEFFINAFQILCAAPSHENKSRHVKAVCEYFYERKNFYHIILSYDLMSDYYIFFLDRLRKIFASHIQISDFSGSKELYLYTSANTLLGWLEYWDKYNFCPEPAEFAAMCTDIFDFPYLDMTAFE